MVAARGRAGTPIILKGRKLVIKAGLGLALKRTKLGAVMPAQQQSASRKNQSVGTQTLFETKALGEIPRAGLGLALQGHLKRTKLGAVMPAQKQCGEIPSTSLQMDTVLRNQRLRDEPFIGEAMKPAQLMKQLYSYSKLAHRECLCAL
jgi:hypothetical protein